MKIVSWVPSGHHDGATSSESTLWLSTFHSILKLQGNIIVELPEAVELLVLIAIHHPKSSSSHRPALEAPCKIHERPYDFTISELVDLLDSSGGIWLIWNNYEIDCDILVVDPQHIHAFVCRREALGQLPPRE